MIHVLYFAHFRETLKVDKELLDFKENETITDLINRLKTRGDEWLSVFDAPIPVLCACNQEMTTMGTLIKDGDEIAFFPPVTGG